MLSFVRVSASTHTLTGNLADTVKWDTPLLDGYRHEFLSEKIELRGVEWAVLGALKRHFPDVLLLHGYSSPTNLVAMLAAKRKGVRVLVRGDTRLSSRHMRAAHRAIVKRALFRQVDGFVAIGSANSDYYRTMGVASTQIHFAPFSVDNSAFALHERRDELREATRKRLGVGREAKVVAFASKLILRKRAADLLAAFAKVCAAHRDAVVVIAGSGSEESALRTAAAPLRQSCDVRRISEPVGAACAVCSERYLRAPFVR